METHYITVTVQIKVQSNLSIEDTIEQFNNNTDYNFTDTEDVEVIESEILEINLVD